MTGISIMNGRLSREDLRQGIEDILKSQDLALYDIEYPVLESATLRIFICKSAGGNLHTSITLDECAKASRKIMDWFEAEQAGTDEWAIEVSSPGVNRKLRTLEHFQNAVGERIKISFTDRNSGTKKTLLVKLQAVDGESLQLIKAGSRPAKKQKRSPSAGKSEDVAQQFSVELADVREAHVDFDFNI